MDGSSAMIAKNEPKKILIADDADVFRNLEDGLLKIYGHTILHAKNGAEAIRLAVEEKPDLVLLDVQMPVMDGMQVLSFLKKDAHTSHIPVIVITTIGRDKDEDIIRRAGADGFLTKPIKATVFVETVRRALELGERTKASNSGERR
jgi:CheY-like chemotaxis protein